MKTPEKIAVTGRVANWIENPESRLPVSCTVFVVQDSYEGPDGIGESITFAAHALRYGAGCAIHLSNLRPRGHDNGKGLIASGPVSFAKIYSTLNEVLRRGGHYRSGAVTVHLDAKHTDLEEFISATRAELPWIKRCIDVKEEWWNDLTQEVKDKIYKGVQAGDIWLNKVKYNDEGERIYGNVCLEIYLPSRGTCLLSHISMGACGVGDLPDAFIKGMSQLCLLHRETGVDRSGEYLPHTKDRQVGLGLLGMANWLALHGVSYAAFGEALRCVNNDLVCEQSPALILAEELKYAIDGAATIARANFMERAFTIAPTATCSYNYTDLEGNTTAPEIAPPIAREVDRDSGTYGVQSYSYGNVEIAIDVGWDAYKAVADGVVTMFERTKLFHGYSYNSWSDVVTYDEAFFADWFASPQTSLYYALQVAPDTLRKDDVSSIMDEAYQDIFEFDKEETKQFCSACAE